VEATIVILISTTIIFFLPTLDYCRKNIGTEINYIRYTCPEGEYNGLATLLY
jgi:hypothetical protein